MLVYCRLMYVQVKQCTGQPQTTSSFEPEPAAVSFKKLMPIPHRSREMTKRKRPKPPSPELTCNETLKFVKDSLDKKRRPAKKPTKQDHAACGKSSAASVPAKQRIRHRPTHKRVLKEISLCSITDDKEPCAFCKIQYGDKDDPHIKDNWDQCTKCKKWWHETCAALSGAYKNEKFSCDNCSLKKQKKQ